MNWRRRIQRYLSLAVIGGVLATATYWGLLHTTALHGFAAKALGPANNLVLRHLGWNCLTRSCYPEVLAANVFLYTIWIGIVLIGVDTLAQLKRKLVERH